MFETTWLFKRRSEDQARDSGNHVRGDVKDAKNLSSELMQDIIVKNVQPRLQKHAGGIMLLRYWNWLSYLIQKFYWRSKCTKRSSRFLHRFHYAWKTMLERSLQTNGTFLMEHLLMISSMHFPLACVGFWMVRELKLKAATMETNTQLDYWKSICIKDWLN